MKEYDIFLKRRLAEGTIIVYSLPYRDGVSVVNRVILQAMLSYFALQKKIAVSNQSSLLAELDEMLTTVSERIGDQVCLDAHAKLALKYQNELEQAAMELDIPTFVLFAQSFFGYTKSSIGNTLSKMSLLVASLGEQKQVFGAIQNRTVFQADSLAFVKHDFEQGESAMEIGLANPELYYRYTMGMEAAFAIAASISETEFHYSLGDGSSAMNITTSKPKTAAEKRLQINNIVEMFSSLVVETISMFAVSNSTEILSVLNAGMKRYRLLSELDDKTLTEIDNITLKDLDFVVLA